MAEKNNKKTLYYIIGGIIILLIYVKVQQPFMSHTQVLPEAGYCIEKGYDVSYTTMLVNGTRTPIEYCALEKFCEEFEVSIVLSEYDFDQELLDRTQELWEGANYSCFQETARHTQEDEIISLNEGELIKSKFLCCNKYGQTSTEGYCEENICNGRFTGVKDSHDCKIYAIEECMAETTCELIGGEIVCDPQPYSDGDCIWETESNYGETYFTSFTNCGLDVVESCGTVKKYCCDKTCTIPCDMTYAYGTGKFVKGCGGYVTGGN